MGRESFVIDIAAVRSCCTYVVRARLIALRVSLVRNVQKLIETVEKFGRESGNLGHLAQPLQELR